MIFIPNFNTKEGEKKIKANQEKFISLLLIFGHAGQKNEFIYFQF